MRVIRKQLIRRSLEMIEGLSKKEGGEDYKTFWENFGRNLKVRMHIWVLVQNIKLTLTSDVHANWQHEAWELAACQHSVLTAVVLDGCRGIRGVCMHGAFCTQC